MWSLKIYRYERMSITSFKDGINLLNLVIRRTILWHFCPKRDVIISDFRMFLSRTIYWFSLDMQIPTSLYFILFYFWFIYQNIYIYTIKWLYFFMFVFSWEINTCFCTFAVIILTFNLQNMFAVDLILIITADIIMVLYDFIIKLASYFSIWNLSWKAI